MVPKISSRACTVPRQSSQCSSVCGAWPHLGQLGSTVSSTKAAAAAAAALLPSLRGLTVCSIARLRASCLGDRSHRLPIEYHLRHNGKSVSSTSSSEKSRETLRINVLNRFAAERLSVGITMQCLQHNRWVFIKTMHNNKGSTTDVINVRRIFNVL